MTDGLTDGAWLGCISADQRWLFNQKYCCCELWSLVIYQTMNRKVMLSCFIGETENQGCAKTDLSSCLKLNLYIHCSPSSQKLTKPCSASLWRAVKWLFSRWQNKPHHIQQRQHQQHNQNLRSRRRFVPSCHTDRYIVAHHDQICWWSLRTSSEYRIWWNCMKCNEENGTRYLTLRYMFQSLSLLLLDTAPLSRISSLQGLDSSYLFHYYVCRILRCLPRCIRRW